ECLVPLWRLRARLETSLLGCEVLLAASALRLAPVAALPLAVPSALPLRLRPAAGAAALRRRAQPLPCQGRLQIAALLAHGLGANRPRISRLVSRSAKHPTPTWASHHRGV